MKYKTWDSTMQSLRRENANLKEQVEEERKRNRVSESVKLYIVCFTSVLYEEEKFHKCKIHPYFKSLTF